MPRWLCAVLAPAVTVAIMVPHGLAHDGVVHADAEEAAQHRQQAGSGGAGEALPFPVDIEVRFDLVDQTGARRTETDFLGRPMALFFGYANCQSICSVALSRIGAALDALGPEGETLQPVMITVDPARDTPEAMGRALHDINPRFIGLTGDDAHLAAARAAFQVETSQVATDIDGGPIFAHGSFIYLIGADGTVASVIPPVLGPERIAEIVRDHFYAP
jgi:protein SCO1